MNAKTSENHAQKPFSWNASGGGTEGAAILLLSCGSPDPFFMQQIAGRPRFGSVRLRFGSGRVRAVPVFGSGGSSAKGFF